MIAGSRHPRRALLHITLHIQYIVCFKNELDPCVAYITHNTHTQENTDIDYSLGNEAYAPSEIISDWRQSKVKVLISNEDTTELLPFRRSFADVQ